MAKPTLQKYISPNLQLANLFSELAQAVHGQQNMEQILTWVTNAIQSISNADLVGLWTIDPFGLPRWTSAGWAGSRIEDLGDARLEPGLNYTLKNNIGGAWPPRKPFAKAGNSSLIKNLAHRIGVRDLLLLPIPKQSYGTQGILAIGQTKGPEQDPNSISILEKNDYTFTAIKAICTHLSVALDNKETLASFSGREATRQEIVHQLQEAVRPTTPEIPLVELGVFYTAADPAEPSGGDLYDWIPLPDGDLHLVVVDIMGKGVSATKDALAVTHALRLLVLEGCPLEKLIEKADKIVTAQNPELVATLIVGRYNPNTGHIRIAGAGHPPALVIHQNQVQEIYAPGIPIGWPGAGSSQIIELDLQRSDALVFYTDGLIESTKDIEKGLAALCRFASETAQYPAPYLARALVERALAGAVRKDDSLALVLRRRTPPAKTTSVALAPLEYHFSRQPATVSLARHFLKDWLERVPVEQHIIDDLLLVGSELCSNAVINSTPTKGAQLTLRAKCESSDVVLEVENPGSEFLWKNLDNDLPDFEKEEGRGLFLVNALTDLVTIENTNNITTIRCVKKAVVG